MTTIADNHLFIDSCNEISSIMMPFLKDKGITAFNYYRIYYPGKVIRLSNHKLWAQHYFKKNYLANLTLPKSYLKKQLNYYIWLTNDCKDMLLDAALNFNMANGISIAKKHFSYIEYFCFSSTKDNSAIVNNYYINNLEELNNYSNFFLDKAKSIIDKSLKTPIILHNKAICYAELQQSYKDSFNMNLNKREQDCALMLLKGASYKNIAHNLKLSVRTIEYYISKLKDKLQIRNKSELILYLNKYYHMAKH